MCLLGSVSAVSAEAMKIGTGHDPAIYADKIVWSDNGSIHLYNQSSGIEIKIRSLNATHPAIYGERLVWHKEEGSRHSLVVYDMLSGDQSCVRCDVDRFSTPAIYGNKIVWSANYNETNLSRNVYMRDVSTSKQRWIALGDDPGIYGFNITYAYYDEDKGHSIALYNITTGEAIRLPYFGDLGSPHIGSEVVIWSDTYTRMGSLAIYDFATQEVTLITSDSDYSGDPENPDCGCDTGFSSAAWEDRIVYIKITNDCHGIPGIYVFNTSTSENTLVFRTEEGVFAKVGVYGDIVVWGISDSYSKKAENYSIYIYDLSAE